MRRILQTFLIFLLLLSNLFAEEEIYSYKFNLDTTLTGSVVSEGNIFPNSKTTFVSIVTTYKNETSIPYIEFLDEKFSSLKKIFFEMNNKIQLTPLVYDFDNDSFDEVVFAIEEKSRIWYLYFDPSSTPQIERMIFELPILKSQRSNTSFPIRTYMNSVQLDNDEFAELIISISGTTEYSLAPNGLFAIDIETKNIFWEHLSAEKTNGKSPISILYKDSPFLVYSGNASKSRNRRLEFSNGIYFYKNFKGKTTIYNRNMQKEGDTKIDRNSKDYSSDSLAFIRAVDNNNKMLWERIIGGNHTRAKIDTIRINNEIKVALSIFSMESKSDIVSSIEIISPRTGLVESKTIIKNGIKNIFIINNSIIVSSPGGEIISLDFKLKEKKSAKSVYWYSPIAITNDSLLLAREGSGIVQSLVALNNDLNKVAKISTNGVYKYLPKSELVSVYSLGIRKSKLYSIQPIPWYKRLSTTLLMNLSISFLLIVLVTMLLWINTLRVSSKKIRKQKKEIEETHAKLKETTAKLIRSEKLAVYGTIASGIAHEINSPLGAIINSAQRIKNNPDTDLEKNITLIEKAGKRSKAIVEKLLVSTSKNKDYKTNLVDVLDDWKELSQKQFENLGISLISTINCNKLLSISSTELNQILTNLFFNARDAIADSKSSVKEIFISSQMEGNYCHILIKDTGPGFCEEKLKNPFDAFETTKEKGKGTGLGLWVVKSILDNINGNIQIRNYEKGAEIEVTIPLFKEGKT